MPADRRAQFVDIAVAESRVLTERLNTALLEYADALKGSLTLEDMRAVDLLAVVQRRIARRCSCRRDRGCRCRALAAGGQLRDRAGDDLPGGAAGERLRHARLPAARGHRRQLRRGRPGLDRRHRRQRCAVAVGRRADARRRRGDAAHPARRARAPRRRGLAAGRQDPPDLALPLAAAARRGGRAVAFRGTAAESRPEFYDFDLFERIDAAGALAERRLSELSYTSFDTETTGLEPSAGDEIISIGAVRIVNGRMLKQEVFEQLVNPRRPISRESTAVHGIDARSSPTNRRSSRCCRASTASARTRCWSRTTRRSTCGSWN
jgi:DNA polymerase III subunit epsilon